MANRRQRARVPLWMVAASHRGASDAGSFTLRSATAARPKMPPRWRLRYSRRSHQLKALASSRPAGRIAPPPPDTAITHLPRNSHALARNISPVSDRGSDAGASSSSGSAISFLFEPGRPPCLTAFKPWFEARVARPWTVTGAHQDFGHTDTLPDPYRAFPFHFELSSSARSRRCRAQRGPPIQTGDIEGMEPTCDATTRRWRVRPKPARRNLLSNE